MPFLPTLKVLVLAQLTHQHAARARDQTANHKKGFSCNFPLICSVTHTVGDSLYPVS